MLYLAIASASASLILVTYVALYCLRAHQTKSTHFGWDDTGIWWGTSMAFEKSSFSLRINHCRLTFKRPAHPLAIWLTISLSNPVLTIKNPSGLLPKTHGLPLGLHQKAFQTTFNGLLVFVSYIGRILHLLVWCTLSVIGPLLISHHPLISIKLDNSIVSLERSRLEVNIQTLETVFSINSKKHARQDHVQDNSPKKTSPRCLSVMIKFGALAVRPWTTKPEQDSFENEAIVSLPSGGQIKLLHPFSPRNPLSKHDEIKVALDTVIVNYNGLVDHQRGLAVRPPNSANQGQELGSRKGFPLRSFRVVCGTVKVESVVGNGIRSGVKIKGVTVGADKTQEKQNIRYRSTIGSGEITWYIVSSTKEQDLELVHIDKIQADSTIILAIKKPKAPNNVPEQLSLGPSKDTVTVDVKIKGTRINANVNKFEYIASAFKPIDREPNRPISSDSLKEALFKASRLPRLQATIVLDDLRVNVCPISIDELDPKTGKPISMKGELVNKRTELSLSCDYINQTQLLVSRPSKPVNNHMHQTNPSAPKEEWVYTIGANIKIDNIRLGHTSSEWCNIEGPGRRIELVSLKNGRIDLKTCLSRINNESQSSIKFGPWITHLAEISVSTKRLKLVPWDSMPITSPLYFWTQFVLSPVMQHRPEVHPVKKRAIEWPWALALRIKLDLSNTLLVCTGTDWAFVRESDVELGTLHTLPMEDKTLRMRCFVQNINGLVYTFPKNSPSFDNRPRFHSSFGYTPGQSTKPQDRPSMGRSGTLKSLSDGTLRLITKGVAIKYKFGTIKDDIPVTSRDKQFKEKLLLWNSQTTITGELYKQPGHAHEISVSTVVSMCGVAYSIDSHYAMLLMLVALRDMRDGKYYQQSPESMVSKVSTHEKRMIVRSSQFQLDHIDIRVSLPQNQHLYFRGEYLQVEWCKVDKSPLLSMASKSFNVFGVHPSHNNKWALLAAIKDINTGAYDRLTEPDKKAYELSIGSLDVCIPNGFMFSDLMSQLSLALKGIKALGFRLSRTGHPFIDILPSEKSEHSSPGFQRLSITSGPVSIQLEDNPFDIRLRHIFTNGLEEQKRRFKSEMELDKSIHHKTDYPVDQRQKYWDFDNCRPPFIGSHGDADRAQYSLDAYNETSWVRRIKDSYKEEKKAYKRVYAPEDNEDTSIKSINQTYESHSNVNEPKLLQFFMIDVMPVAKSPPLMSLDIDNVEVQVGQPSFKTGNEPSFINELGNVPRDKKYASLTSIGLNIKAGETLARLRDYPLPLLHIPVSATSDPSDGYIAWSLEGDYIIARELGTQDGISLLTVPVLYAITTNVDYKFNLPRICSPLKFYSKVNIKIFNNNRTLVGYGASYAPAVKDLRGVLEKFSSPSADPSPKLGIWDKLRFCLHTQTAISFVGGGTLCVLLKGLRDPYNIEGLGAGLVNVWSKDVAIHIGFYNPEQEYVQIISGEFILNVPDLINGKLLNLQDYPFVSSKSIQARPVSFRLEDNHDFQHISAPQDFDSKKVPARVLEKTILFLEKNVQFGLRWEFERYCLPLCPNCVPGENNEGRCRTYEFLPHYSVYLKSRETARQIQEGWVYDAYYGFRSDFIHFSVRISAGFTKDEMARDLSSNAVYLTPKVLDHYSSWKSMFNRALQLNVRSGQLFPKKDKRQKQKIGKHMSTIKFKINISNLFISYIFQVDKTNKSNALGNRKNDVGLKIRLGKFYLDAHRGKQDQCDMPPPKQGMPPVKPKWFYYNTEIRLYDADVRGVRAIYRTDDRPGPNTNHGLKETTNGSEPLPSKSSQISLEDYIDFDPDYDPPKSWIDSADLTDLDKIPPEFNPYVKMYPLIFTPCIKFKKTPNKDYIERNGLETETYDCSLTEASEADKFQLLTVQESIVRMEKLIFNRLTSSNVLNNIHINDLRQKRDVLIDRLCTLEYRLGIEPSYLLTGPDDFSSTSSASNLIAMPVDEDGLEPWENYMGRFDNRATVHNPQIIWSENIKGILDTFREAEMNKRILAYVTSERYVKLIRECILKMLSGRGPSAVPRTSSEAQESEETPASLDMLKKLLDDLSTYPPQRNLDGKTIDSIDEDSSFGPRLQIESIPDGFTMKSDFLVDLLNPQIRIQTKYHHEAGILLTNELINVKTFTITDSNNSDLETGLVKKRRLVSLKDSQLFITPMTFKRRPPRRKGDRSNQDEFAYNTMIWAHLEVLLNTTDKVTPGLSRISYSLDVNIQHEEHNPLYVKSNLSVLDSDYFDDPCDKLHIHFPSISLEMNPSEYRIVYSIVTGLLANMKPTKLELRAAALSEIMKNTSRSNLITLSENVSNLQERFRFLQTLQTQYNGMDLPAEDSRIRSYDQRQDELENCFNQLYMTMEVAKSIKLLRQESTKDRPAIQSAITVSIPDAFLKLRSKELDSWFNIKVVDLQGGILRNELQVVRKSFEMARIALEDLSNYSLYNRIIDTAADCIGRLPDTPNLPKLRVCLVSLPQVANMDVIQELSIDMVPLKIRLSYMTGKNLLSFFFPGETQGQPNEDTLLDEISGFRLFSETPSIDLDSGEVILPGGISMNRGEYVDGPLTDSPESLSDPEDKHLMVPMLRTARHFNPFSNSSTPMTTRPGMGQGSTPHIFGRINIQNAKHCITYRGENFKSFYDLTDLEFLQPALEYRNKTWTWYEFLCEVKKDMRKAAYGHYMAIIQQKARRHRGRSSTVSSRLSTTLYNENDNISSDSESSEGSGSRSRKSYSLRSSIRSMPLTIRNASGRIKKRIRRTMRQTSQRSYTLGSIDYILDRNK
ncbi:golgi-body localization protein domain-containing protein [Phycomyces nitens]|nr:golgi-body localization protein domain-containing protein [Phycomyces nitens]